MKQYNLHIVRSPLQLINILEAIETLSLENNILVIIDRKSMSNNRQIQEVLKAIDYPWAMQFHIEKKSKTSFLDYVKLIKKIRAFHFKHIFTGDIDSISNVIIANLKHEKIFLVDDGTSTLKRHEALLKDSKLRFKDRMKLLRFSMFGLKAHKEYKLNFFTFFDIAPKADETIVKNAFTHLKKQFNLSQSKSDKVYILGQPIYNKEIPEDIFIEHLEKILKYYQGKEIVYVKHRYENIPQKVAALLKDRVEIYVNKYPIELDFLIKQEYPRYITGFFSTALYTLKQMFPESEVTLFHIDKKHFFNPERSEVVENYYTFFNDNGFKTIK